MKIPAWLGSANDYAPCPLAGVRVSDPFVERGIVQIAAVIRAGSREGLDQPRGFLGAADPAAKVLSCALLLLAVACTSSVTALMTQTLVIVVLATLAGLPALSFVAQVVTVVSVFGVAAAFPALFSSFTPGEALVSFGPVVVTKPGAFAVARLLSRMTASLAPATLLIKTTSVAELTGAANRLGVPAEFTTIAAMTWRYIHVLATEVYQMHMGLLSRRIVPLGGSYGRAYVTSRIAVLFGKSMRTADEIHQAMVSRGFDGGWRSLPGPKRPGAALLTGALVIAVLTIAAGKVGLP